MKALQRIDSRLDPFFQRHWKGWALAGNLIYGIGFPAAILATVLFGTRALPNNGYEIRFFTIFMFYGLSLLSIFGRYMRRYTRQVYKQTLAFMWFALIACVLIVLLSFPGWPLAKYWHAPAPSTNIILLIVVVLTFGLGLLALKSSKEPMPGKKLFKA